MLLKIMKMNELFKEQLEQYLLKIAHSILREKETDVFIIKCIPCMNRSLLLLKLSLSLFTFMHWRRKWQPTPVFLPRESQGQGSLVGCCLWGRAELDTTEATQQQQQQQEMEQWTGSKLGKEYIKAIFCHPAYLTYMQSTSLENEMATHSSVLAQRIPGTGEPGGLPSMGSHRVGHD